MSTSLQIAMVAGEPSGDRQGAALVQALREITAPQIVEAWGIGGHFMREAGIHLRHDSDPWAAIGIADTLAKIPRMLQVLWDMKRALRHDPPDALVVIDAGAFNVPLARWAKRYGICPVFYYFPPGSWRKNSVGGRGRKNLATVTDRIVTPFPWSETMLRAGGADAHFVGHPLLDLVKPALHDADFHARFGLDASRPIVCLAARQPAGGNPAYPADAAGRGERDHPPNCRCPVRSGAGVCEFAPSGRGTHSPGTGKHRNCSCGCTKPPMPPGKLLSRR